MILRRKLDEHLGGREHLVGISSRAASLVISGRAVALELQLVDAAVGAEDVERRVGGIRRRLRQLEPGGEPHAAAVDVDLELDRLALPRIGEIGLVLDHRAQRLDDRGHAGELVLRREPAVGIALDDGEPRYGGRARELPALVRDLREIIRIDLGLGDRSRTCSRAAARPRSPRSRRSPASSQAIASSKRAAAA